LTPCLICARDGDGRRHEGSVGGNVYEDDRFYAYHAPPAISTLGQLFVVAKRHFLDFAEMAPEETASFGPILTRLCTAIKQTVDAERVYVQVTIEGVPHFHAWLIPRPKASPLRGRDFVGSARSCSDADALAVVDRLRAALSSSDR
jgi:diadenosine tetraphosphate (Ap4A) HIT family hydrolase